LLFVGSVWNTFWNCLGYKDCLECLGSKFMFMYIENRKTSALYNIFLFQKQSWSTQIICTKIIFLEWNYECKHQELKKRKYCLVSKLIVWWIYDFESSRQSIDTTCNKKITVHLQHRLCIIWSNKNILVTSWVKRLSEPLKIENSWVDFFMKM